MNEIPFVNVDDWKDVLAIAIIVVGGWATTFITLRRGQKRAHQSHVDLSARVQGIKEQVVNGHTTPLREDLDGMRNLLTDMHGLMVEQSKDIGRVRDDVHSLTTRIDRLEKPPTSHRRARG